MRVRRGAAGEVSTGGVTLSPPVPPPPLQTELEEGRHLECGVHHGGDGRWTAAVERVHQPGHRHVPHCVHRRAATSAGGLVGPGASGRPRTPEAPRPREHSSLTAAPAAPAARQGVDFLRLCFARDPTQRPDVTSLLIHPFVRGIAASAAAVRHIAPALLRPATADGPRPASVASSRENDARRGALKSAARYALGAPQAGVGPATAAAASDEGGEAGGCRCTPDPGAPPVPAEANTPARVPRCGSGPGEAGDSAHKRLTASASSFVSLPLNASGGSLPAASAEASDPAAASQQGTARRDGGSPLSVLLGTQGGADVQSRSDDPGSGPGTARGADPPHSGRRGSRGAAQGEEGPARPAGPSAREKATLQGLCIDPDAPATSGAEEARLHSRRRGSRALLELEQEPRPRGEGAALEGRDAAEAGTAVTTAAPAHGRRAGTTPSNGVGAGTSAAEEGRTPTPTPTSAPAPFEQGATGTGGGEGVVGDRDQCRSRSPPAPEADQEIRRDSTS